MRTYIKKTTVLGRLRIIALEGAKKGLRHPTCLLGRMSADHKN